MRERIEKAADNIQRPAGLKIATFKMAPSAPIFADLHWRARGANQKLLFHQGNKKVVAARTHSSGYPSLFSFRFFQYVSLRDRSNSRTTWRFSAHMTPIRGLTTSLGSAIRNPYAAGGVSPWFPKSETLSPYGKYHLTKVKEFFCTVDEI
jgi:hypothetical protein